MKDADVKRIEASVKILKEEHQKLEKLMGEWEDEIAELEEKDTESSNEKAEELQSSRDSLEEYNIALNETIENLEALKDE